MTNNVAVQVTTPMVRVVTSEKGPQGIQGIQGVPGTPADPNATAEGIYSVKSYGAEGDGSTNDSAAIHAADLDLYNMTLADGVARTLYFPPGVYMLGTRGGAQVAVEKHSRVNWWGAGKHATILRRVASANVDLVSTPSWYSSAPRQESFFICGMQLDGHYGINDVGSGRSPSAIGGNGGYGLLLKAGGVTGWDLAIRGCKEQGLHLATPGSGASFPLDTPGMNMYKFWDVELFDCYGTTGPTHTMYYCGTTDCQFGTHWVYHRDPAANASYHLIGHITAGGCGYTDWHMWSIQALNTVMWVAGANNVMTCMKLESADSGGVVLQVNSGGLIFQGSIYNNTGGLPMTGVRLGDGASSAPSTHLIAKIDSCETAGIEFTSTAGGGSTIDCSINYVASGNSVVGTVPGTTDMRVVTGVGATVGGNALGPLIRKPDGSWFVTRVDQTTGFVVAIPVSQPNFFL